MATLSERITAALQEVAGDIKALRLAKGDLTTLNTAEKTNLVGAINELRAAVVSATNIDDTKGSGDTTFTWSVDKVFTTIAMAITAVKDDILGGVGGAFDTLKELQDALGADANYAVTIAQELSNRVRFDAPQTLDAAQKLQARENIGALSGADLTTLIGDPDTDLVTIYTAAKL